MPTISDLLFSADNGQLKMPEFQRGWVWKRKNVKELFDSLYRGYPIGSIIVWPTFGDDGRPYDSVIDGQQRLSTLYAVVRGAKPPWFKGQDESALVDLLFNLQKEEFDYATKARRREPLWVGVTKVIQDPEWWFGRLPEMKLEPTLAAEYTQRITRLSNLSSKELLVSRLPDKTSVEDAYRVFKVVNRAGTTVSEGDLVLGQISLKWQDAREIIEKRIGRWSSDSFEVPLEWLLHSMAAVLGNGIEYDDLVRANRDRIEQSYNTIVEATEDVQNLLRDQLGFDRGQATRFNTGLIPVAMARVARGGSSSITADRRLLAWWLLGTLWRRWSSDTRNRVNRDLRIVADGEGVEGLMRELRKRSEGISLQADHFEVRRGPSQSALRLMRVMTRRCGARSLGNGLSLSFEHAGDLAGLQAHHIFPRALLREQNELPKRIDEVANLAFIRHDDNLAIGARAPTDYLPEMEERNPGVLASQWIPPDRELWKPARYRDFLAVRRGMLAESANDFLARLLGRSLTAW
jgi:hypothetical protein